MLPNEGLITYCIMFAVDIFHRFSLTRFLQFLNKEKIKFGTVEKVTASAQGRWPFNKGHFKFNCIYKIKFYELCHMTA